MTQNTFPGFVPPTENWSKLPHVLIEALPLIETVGELKIILYVLRHTWGYHETEKRISQDEFENGRKRKDGTRLDPGTGLSRNTIKDGIKRAVAHGFIIVETDDHDKARIQHWYRLAELAPSEGQKLPPTHEPEDQTLTGGGQSLTPRGSKVDPPTAPEGQTLTVVHGKKPVNKKQTNRKKNTGASAPAPNPAQQQLARLRSKLGSDPLSVAAASERAQQDAGGRIWTIPVEAGGTDTAGALMLRAWLETNQLDPDLVPKKTHDKYQAALSRLASTFDTLSPAQAANAVEIVLDRDNPEFSYYTYANPSVKKFADDWTAVALRLLCGQPGYLTVTGKVPRNYDNLINRGDTETDLIIPDSNTAEWIIPHEPPSEATQLWHAVQDELKLQMTRATFNTWIKPLTCLSLDRDACTATLQAPNAYIAEWITERLSAPIARTLAGVADLPPDQFSFTCQASEQ